MEFDSLILILTSDCNFSCSYCYQVKEDRYLDPDTIQSALDFFFPRMRKECAINFYGGEPLLAFEAMRGAVDTCTLLNKKHDKRIQYSLTTNGSLFTDEIYDFLERNRFSLLVSYDGLCQDNGRTKGSMGRIQAAIERLTQSSEIELCVNSVLTPSTVADLADSVRSIVDLGVEDVHVSLSTLPRWDRDSLETLRRQLGALRTYLAESHPEPGSLPISLFRDEDSGRVFGCLAGRDRMALAPDGTLWGCSAFYDEFKRLGCSPQFLKYGFGGLDMFIRQHEEIYPAIIQNYSGLRMDNFCTDDEFCMFCEHVYGCSVCPVDARMGSSIMGKIPDWVCRMRRILIGERRQLQADPSDR
jgi:MoaA/NifB/PqqE/SkfB family radical SAM enzyme